VIEIVTVSRSVCQLPTVAREQGATK